MNKIFTQDEYNWLLKEEQELLSSSVAECDEAELVPRNDCIKNILDFSKAYSCSKSESIGCIETILN